MLPHETACRIKLILRQAVIGREFYLGFDPEFGFAVRTLNVNMHATFFPREEIEPEWSIAKNRRTHQGYREPLVKVTSVTILTQWLYQDKS